MKTRLLLLLIILPLLITAQKSQILKDHYENEWQTFSEMVARSEMANPDTGIDVKFYHLALDININYPYLTGSTRILLEPAAETIDHFQLDLNRSLTVDSIQGPVADFEQAGDDILIDLSQNFEPGEEIDITIHYQGAPQMAGGYKGMRYATHNGNEPVIATLSTPYLAHYWYPCKDGPGDKPDSVYVDVIVPDTEISGVEVKGVSNGVLEDVQVVNGKKTFMWRHRYPIVTYYVMAAVSNYEIIEQDYAGIYGEQYPLEYFVFSESYNSALAGVEDMPMALDAFSDLFGIYPFYAEKYGMTQLGFYGAIENQTNTIINNMSSSWFMISVHELGHMWFGDMITCKNWHHGWLNEGFATYSEALYVEAQEGRDAYLQYIAGDQYYEGGTLYLENAQDTFNIFQSIIYSKGSYVLHMLRGVLGDSVFFDGLKSYATDPDLMYGHAETSDLQAIMEEASGTDLEFFFDQWIYDARYPSYRYNFESNPFEAKALISLKQVQGEYGWRPVFEMPVTMKLHFTDGSDTLVTLWNDQQVQTFELDIEKEINIVQFDPEGWLLDQAVYDPGLPVGLQEKMPESEISVYPNPSGDRIMLTGVTGIAGLELITTTGKMIRRFDEPDKGMYDLEDIIPGMYLLRIRHSGGTDVIKLLKE